MRLETDQAGLRMVAMLPDTEEGRSVHTAVKRGDLSGMSFAFVVADGGSHYDPKTNTRVITKIKKILSAAWNRSRIPYDFGRQGRDTGSLDEPKPRAGSGKN